MWNWAARRGASHEACTADERKLLNCQSGAVAVATRTCPVASADVPFYGVWGTSCTVKSRSFEVFCGFASAAAFFAAHRAFIAAASCARRSGERLSFLFTVLAARGVFALADITGASAVTRLFFFWVCAELFILRRAPPERAADFLLVLPAAAVAAASSFCFSLASFFAPFCRRASSRRIFFRRVFFIMRSIVLRLNHLVDLSSTFDLETSPTHRSACQRKSDATLCGHARS
jgi:hypothetical protein